MIAVQAEPCGTMTERDRLYETVITQPGEFVFDERVVRVFPDMINRSVPGYATVVPMLGMLARRYAQADSELYDLGCSLGAVALAMQAAVRAPGARIVAVDNAPDMIRALEARLGAAPAEQSAPPIRVVQQDILVTPIERASVTVLNFTLQFVPPEQRSGLLARIAAGTLPGGVLLLSEKIRFADPVEDDLQIEWHHDFKRARGYSDLEVARKREALENVLLPEPLETHRARLEEAGFTRVYRWFQGFNFVSLVAFR
ncbi:MAG: carboxy-S-adenosyl-L-methionine synthase CmoA [Xanthomonadales bacterium]